MRKGRSCLVQIGHGDEVADTGHATPQVLNTRVLMCTPASLLRSPLEDLENLQIGVGQEELQSQSTSINQDLLNEQHSN